MFSLARVSPYHGLQGATLCDGGCKAVRNERSRLENKIAGCLQDSREITVTICANGSC